MKKQTKSRAMILTSAVVILLFFFSVTQSMPPIPLSPDVVRTRKASCEEANLAVHFTENKSGDITDVRCRVPQDSKNVEIGDVVYYIYHGEVHRGIVSEVNLNYDAEREGKTYSNGDPYEDKSIDTVYQTKEDIIKDNL